MAGNNNNIEPELREGRGTWADSERPESDVFLSPQVSVDPDHGQLNIPKTTERSHLDSGYVSSYRSVSSVGPCLEQDKTEPSSPDANMNTMDGAGSALHESDAADSAPHSAQARFYMVQDSIEEEEDEFGESADILLEGGDDVDADADLSDFEELHLSGASVETVVEAGTPVSNPLDIPGASSIHSVHASALHAMDATPPRSYHTHPAPHLASQGASSLPGHHHYSTGCMSKSPHIVQLLSSRQGTRCGELTERAIRVTSSHLHASSSRAALHRQRTISETDDTGEDDVMWSQRDRSQSAPDLGHRRKLLERQCAAELRKISDEFFQDFTQTKGTSSRVRDLKHSPVSMTTHARSYPGTCGQSRWWWQTIIQNLSPAIVRAPARATPPNNNHLSDTDLTTERVDDQR